MKARLKSREEILNEPLDSPCGKFTRVSREMTLPVIKGPLDVPHTLCTPKERRAVTLPEPTDDWILNASDN